MVLSSLLYGVAHDLRVSIPSKPDIGGGKELEMVLSVFENDLGDSYFAIQTRPDENISCSSMARIRSVMDILVKDDELEGLVINPYTERIMIPKKFLETVTLVYNSGCNDAWSKEETDEKIELDEPATDGCSVEVNCSLPMTEAQYNGIEALIGSLRDKAYEHLLVKYQNPDSDDGVIFMQVARNTREGCYHLEIAYDMADFGWNHPLILAHDNLTLEQTAKLFYEIGVNGTSTEEIEIIQEEFQEIEYRKK